MIDLKQLQKDIYANKAAKGFNITDVEKEFRLLLGEVDEALEAYREKKDGVGEELADVAIYLLGIAEILGVDLEQELKAKAEKNAKRVYAKKDGRFVKTA